jgi:hypothetical protein
MKIARAADIPAPVATTPTWLLLTAQSASWSIPFARGAPLAFTCTVQYKPWGVATDPNKYAPRPRACNEYWATRFLAV